MSVKNRISDKPSDRAPVQVADSTRALLQREVSRQKLPVDFIQTVTNFYLPVANGLNSQLTKTLTPLLVLIQGSQGSGKSTFASFLKLLLEAEYSRTTVALSIDDFYLTKKQRVELGRSVHQLLQTRGVPGTHDIALLERVLGDLQHRRPTLLPIFDKASDDRVTADRWPNSGDNIELVILEGWCVGLKPQSELALLKPVNELERLEDPQGEWRRFVNDQLREQYRAIFDQFDQQIVLQAPNFDVVYDWRLKQEQKLVTALQEQKRDTSTTLSPSQVERFISHFQRLTEHGLATLPAQADYLFSLNEDHSFSELTIMAPAH